MCGDLREAYDRLYLPYSPSGRGTCTEVDVRGRHEIGSLRSIGCSAHEADEQMVHLQYRHFLSRAEGAEVVVLPVGDHDHMGCFTDQVKLTHALVWDLDEAVKEVKLLGEHEELSQKIIELEAPCKK
jgi:hypothetical protein